MIKLLFFTDPHFTAKNPQSRKDNMFNTVKEKTREILNISINEDIDYVLCGGDIYDSPSISDNVAGEVGEIFLDFKNKGKQIITVAGNHDIIGNSLSTLNQTKLGLLGRLGIIKIIGEQEKILLEKDGIKVQLTGSSSDFGINKDKSKFIVEEKDQDSIAIHIVHAMLLREDQNFGSYMPLKDIIDDTVADVTLSGDFHLGFETLEYKNKLFINPGALVRKYNFLEELERKPQVAIITINDDKSITWELRELECAKNGEEILDRSLIIQKQEYQNKMNEFKEKILANTNSNYYTDINEIISFLAKQDNLEDDVIQEAIKRVDESKINLGL